MLNLLMDLVVPIADQTAETQAISANKLKMIRLSLLMAHVIAHAQLTNVKPPLMLVKLLAAVILNNQ
jgi:hypothetical protein